jgi:hypothetical protein
MSRGLRFLLVLGSASAIFGIIQLLWGWYYAGIVGHEATAVGKIVHIYHGRHGIHYEYIFPLGNLTVRDSARQCKTALSRGGCGIEMPVLVYYDQLNPGTTLLNEFGAESHRDIQLGAWVTPIGLILLLWFYRVYHLGSNTDSEDQSDDRTITGESDILHIVPTDNA